ncbi:MAG: Do family serine endopeptidase [Rhodospirillaceae bacterium]|nr:Do family serine endopeptidase [Rhodospirillaceae bacterium]
MKPILALLPALLLAFAPLPVLAQETVPTQKVQIDLTFAPLVRAAAPAVVNIYTRTVVKARQTSPFFDDPFFNQFFGDQFKSGQPKERVQGSLGSGVIVRTDGLIVTNNHVIAGADQIRVVLNDKREFEAKVIAAEERLDLALLKVDTQGEALPVLTLRDSDEIEVGDLVLAIGNPFGVGQTVTSGIVSGVARTNTGIGDFGYFIQTDAAINPGNSGGALIGTDGKLIGVPTAIFSKSGGSIGIGFAIPANMVAAVIKAEGNGGKLIRPWIGAAGEAVTADIAKSLGLPRPVGVVVQQLYPDGPAEQAGLKPGDIIVGVNGRDVEDPEGLRFRLATLPVGEKASLNVQRKDETMDLSVSLIAPPDTPAPHETLLSGRQPLAGALVVDLSPATGDELNISAWNGVAIAKIKRGSIADRVGFEGGDIIAKINDRKVETVADLVSMMETTAAPWAITINRGGKTKTFDLD